MEGSVYRIKKKLSKYFQPHMIRPILRRALVMLVIAALLALLWDHFVNTAGYFTVRSHVLPVFGVVFLVAAWFCFLLMDRPVSPNFRGCRKKNQPPMTDMADAIETNPESGEDLQPDERAFCSCVAALLCGVICLLISLV